MKRRYVIASFCVREMKNKKIYILLVVLLLNVSAAIADILRVDTIRVEQLIDRFDSTAMESFMLDVLHRQAVERARREDSIHSWRIANDTTTALPFHVGYRDSIENAVSLTEQRYYLETYGLAYKPLAWRKHYVGWDDAVAADTIFMRVGDDNTKMRNVAGILVLMPNKSIVDENSVAPLELQTLEQEKSWAPELEGVKKVSLKKPLKERRWYKEATVLLQVTQNYSTKNWYTGANSSFAVLGIVTGKLDYNDFKHITWENTLEWHAGASTSEADTVRKVNMTDDVFKLYSKFNYKAFNKIYYSVSAEVITQFFDTYKEANSNELVTTFFTPFRFNLNAGIDFKPVKGLSLAVSPLSFKYVYVSDTTRIAQTKFSVQHGKNSLKEVGSSLRVEYSYKPVREFALDSKLYFYTNYKKVEIDLEVVANLIFNQYFSARISLHPRYDNTVILDGHEKAQVQFKELISVGFSHKFR